MDNGLIPHRYAKALYKYAEGQGTAEELYGHVKLLCKAFEGNKGLEKALCNPYASMSDKTRLLWTASGAPADDTLVRFLQLMTSHFRQHFFRMACLNYLKVYTESKGILPVEIQSAVEMTTPLKSKLESVLHLQYTDKRLITTYTVVPGLIGGFIIKTDSSELDASVVAELKRLRAKLLNQNHND